MRTRICLYILLLLPLAVYWQTVFHDYGLREDYGYLRESREEPGRMVKVTASHGRPLNGALLETTFAATEQVDQLVWMRLASVLLLTVLGLALWRQLYQSGWNEVEAAVIGLGVVLLPSAQFVAGAASCWPQALTLLLAMAGFSAIETEVERGGLKRVVALLGGCMIYTVGALIYQSNILFALVPIAAVFLVRSGREPMNDLKWGAIHVATLLAGLLMAYLLVQALFSNGVFEESARLRLETNPFTKLFWFILHPLPNALALYALADDHYLGVIFYAPAALGVLALLVFGFRRSKADGNAAVLRKWKICLFALPFLAQGVSLVAAERAAGYRVLFALAGLVLVLAMYAIRTLLDGRKIKPRVLYSSYAVVALLLAFVAHRHSFLLVAEPQGTEWSLMKGAVLRANFIKPVRAYVITPTAEHRTTGRIYRDEFGALTSGTDRLAQEMFKAAVRTRFPDKLPKGGSYTVASGPTEPDANAYDLVVDMRKLSGAGKP
jgi:uncharacterized membrane protein